MDFDAIILGAGAAGLMCAAHAGGRVLVIDHAKAPGEKIRISGGGRCNFTNLYAGPENFLSENPHFAKSALARYTQWDFIDLVDRYGIAWHEKTLGQLFCDGKSTQIVAMLLEEIARSGADLWLNTQVRALNHRGGAFALEVDKDGARHNLTTRAVVLATGGKSIPKMGATGFAYDIARQFDLAVTETRPALVPLTFPEGRFAGLAGVSVPAIAGNDRTIFEDAVLFTHRGLSGPAILQLSSYWREGEDIRINLAPQIDLMAELRGQRQKGGRVQIKTALSQHLPARLIEYLTPDLHLDARLADQSDAKLGAISTALNTWHLKPSGSEGYRTAEVTLGGISTDAFSSTTMECTHVPGLYAVGEAMDVTGWLGGYNFQWAWASGFAAGQALAARKSI